MRWTLTRSSPGRADARGATLVEVLICAGLMGLVLTGIWYVMVAAARYVRVTNATIDVQRSALTGLARLSQELGETSPYTYTMFNNGRGLFGGITFVSPRDAEGHLRYDVGNRLLWYKMVCYYNQPVNGDKADLMRKERLLPRPTTKPPNPDSMSLAEDPTVTPLLIASETQLYVDDSNAPSQTDDDDVQKGCMLNLRVDAVRTTILDHPCDFRLSLGTSVLLQGHGRSAE